MLQLQLQTELPRNRSCGSSSCPYIYSSNKLGLNDEISVCDNKKLFLFLKSSKLDQTGTPLQHGSRLLTETSKKKTDIHNQQFHAVFTTKEPLSLSRLCKAKLQDMTDSGTMRHEAGVLNSSSVMEEYLKCQLKTHNMTIEQSTASHVPDVNAGEFDQNED